MPETAREIQIAQAQSNPNILSPLSGAPSASENVLAKRAEAQTTPQGAYQEAGRVGQELAGKLYGTGGLQGMAGNWDQAIQELAKYDVMQEQRYVPKQNFTPGYVPNPVDQAGLIAGAGQRAYGAAQTTGSAVQSVQQGYSNSINEVIKSFINFYEIAEQRREKEADRKRLEEGDRINNLISILGQTGGKLDYGGQNYNFPGPKPTQRDTSVIEVGGRKKLIDNQTGQVIQDLGEATVTSGLFNTLGAQSEAKPTTRPTTKPTTSGGYQDWSRMMSVQGARPPAPTPAPVQKPPLSSFWKQ